VDRPRFQFAGGEQSAIWQNRLRVPDLQRTVFGPGGPTNMHNLGLIWPDADDALGELLQSFSCSADPSKVG
jgi:hypothetical protein